MDKKGRLEMSRPADSIGEGPYGAVNFNYAVTEDKLNQRLQEFMVSPRPFTAYPADRLEAVAKHYNLIPQNAHYVGYDPNARCVWFKINNRAHGDPQWITNTKSFISRLLGK